ncbi:MAG: hypothetical protein JNJ83_00550 [Verrucomicrobiaceae bacterium]|nr:hypothetical protein [Verrucomicrobiaceae bacterium]
MSAAFSDDQLRLAARLYYLDGLGQADVARFVRVSQAKVSRLLSTARERGIVRISVAEYEPRDVGLERQLKEQFRLQSVAVIKTLNGSTAEDIRRVTGHFGAEFVRTLIPAESTVAIAGGRTMRELVSMLPQASESQLTVIQAMGSIDSTVTDVDALELGRTVAKRLAARFVTINTPAFVPDKQTRDAFLGLDQLKTVWQQFKSVDVALIGIGTLRNSVFVERGVLSPSNLALLATAGAVGEIFGRFFDHRGRECVTPWRDRVISMSLDQLKKVPQVIAVVSGSDRAPALLAAIRGGLVKSLVVDDTCASALLSLS